MMPARALREMRKIQLHKLCNPCIKGWRRRETTDQFRSNSALRRKLHSFVRPAVPPHPRARTTHSPPPPCARSRDDRGRRLGLGDVALVARVDHAAAVRRPPDARERQHGH